MLGFRRPCRRIHRMPAASPPPRVLTLLLGLATLSADGLAQEAHGGEPTPGHPFFLASVTPDLDGGTLEATWEITFVADTRTAAGFGFGLAPGLTLSVVEGIAVRGFRIGPDPEPGGGMPVRVHEVELEGVAPGDRVTVVLSYAGTPLAGPDGITSLGPDWVELALDAFWFPLVLTFDQAMHGRLRVALPSDWTVASGGPVQVGDGVHDLVFPAPGGLDVAFSAASTLSTLEAEGFVLLHTGEPEDRIERVRSSARRCADWMNARFGALDPLRDLRLVLAPREGPGYQRPNYIVLPRGTSPSPFGYDELLCHEMAHHWAFRADFTTPDHWMNEGLAEYAMALAIRDLHGQEAFEALVARFEAGGRDAGPVWTAESTGRPDEATMYRRAPWLLSQIEARVGGEAFDRFLLRTLTEGVATTPELLRILSEEAGEAAAAAFERALATRGPTPEGGAEGAPDQGRGGRNGAGVHATPTWNPSPSAGSSGGRL